MGRRNLLADRRRLVISVGGVGAALALILFLQGLWLGFQRQITAYEDNVGADLFVAEPGTRSFLGESSTVSMDTVAEVGAMAGVDRADPIVSRGAVLDLHGRKQFASVIGSRPDGLGGPWALAEGRVPRAVDEVVIDETLARQHGLRIGDSIDILGGPFSVVGLSTETRSWMFGFVFVTLDAALRITQTPDSVSFVLVTTVHPQAAARDIRDELGLSTLSPDELRTNDRALLAKSIAGPIELMVAIAFAAGTLIVTLTVYSQVTERIREYGIAKAMGATAARLFRIVLGQTMIVALLGTALAFPMFLVEAKLVNVLRPQFRADMSALVSLVVVGAATLMALLAALLPTRRVSRLDPASVYRG
ncbi:MAG TPA: ABC transporter permease [Actinomycetota bacterium]|nr:ABC transporter permease [Actinomycetota bacterium]